VLWQAQARGNLRSRRADAGAGVHRARTAAGVKNLNSIKYRGDGKCYGYKGPI